MNKNKDLLTERLEKIPYGIHTPGLMGYISDMEEIIKILNRGIISVYEKYIRGEVDHKSGTDMQKSTATSNYVWLHDPFLGYGAMPWHEKAERNFNYYFFREMSQKCRYFHDHDEYKKSYNEGYYFAITLVDKRGSTRRPDDRYPIMQDFPIMDITLNGYKDWPEQIKKLNEIFEECMSRDDTEYPTKHVLYSDNWEKPIKFFIDGKWYDKKGLIWAGISGEIAYLRGSVVNEATPFDPLQYFMPSYGPILLINPEIKRIAAPGSVDGPMSLVKDKINLNDIVGVVLPYSKHKGHYSDEIKSELINIKTECQEKKIPIFLGHTYYGKTPIFNENSREIFTEYKFSPPKDKDKHVSYHYKIIKPSNHEFKHLV